VPPVPISFHKPLLSQLRDNSRCRGDAHPSAPSEFRDCWWDSVGRRDQQLLHHEGMPLLQRDRSGLALNRPSEVPSAHPDPWPCNLGDAADIDEA
jgi:hypothetical protein